MCDPHWSLANSPPHSVCQYRHAGLARSQCAIRIVGLNSPKTMVFLVVVRENISIYQIDSCDCWASLLIFLFYLNFNEFSDGIDIAWRPFQKIFYI